MEHKNEQNEEKKPLEILRGNLGQDVVVETIQTKEKGEKEVANFSIAIKDGENTKWVNCEAWEKNIEKVRDLKKGEFVELKGILKDEYTTAKNETKRDLLVFESTKLSQTIKGNLGADVVIKEVGEPTKKVANFSIAIKEGETTKWINCQAWEKNIEKVSDLKKGDFVEIKGILGKEYGEDKKRDLIVSDSTTLKVAEALKETNALKTPDTDLISGVEKGDYKAVGAALKAGGNPDLIKEDHYKGLSDKTRKSVTDTVESFKLTGKIEEPQKKNKMKV